MLSLRVILLGAFLCVAGEALVGIIAADNGTYSGHSELEYLEAVMIDRAVLNVHFCQSASQGSIDGVLVLLAYTGIGDVNAAICLQELLMNPQLSFSELIWCGTSGFSPVIGGFDPLNDGCDVLPASVQKLSVGSVCIASASVDMECGTCVSNATTSHSECGRPSCTNHDAQFLYGQCDFTTDPTLQMQLAAVAKVTVLPKMPDVLTAGSTSWWAASQAFVDNSAPTNPSIITSCAEADARQIWVGGRLDYLCREYLSNVLKLSPQEVPCVVAMEAVGFHRVLQNYPQIPSVVVRGASNWDMYPLVKIPIQEGGFLWVQNTSYVSDKDHEDFVKAGYQFAIQTTNAVILAYLKNVNRPS